MGTSGLPDISGKPRVWHTTNMYDVGEPAQLTSMDSLYLYRDLLDWIVGLNLMIKMSQLNLVGLTI